MVATTLLASCGSSRLSHDEFVDRANDVCSRYEAAVKKLDAPKTLVAIEAYANRVLRRYRSALGELRALDPPKDDAPSVEAWLAADRRIAADLEALEAAATSRQIPRVQEIVLRTRADDVRSNRIARRLGLAVCARP